MMFLIIFMSPKSTKPRNIAIKIVRTITTAVEASSSLRVGHFTFFNSVLASLKNCPVLLKILEKAFSLFSFFGWTARFGMDGAGFAKTPLLSTLSSVAVTSLREGSVEIFLCLERPLLFTFWIGFFISYLSGFYRFPVSPAKKTMVKKRPPLILLCSNLKIPHKNWQARRDSNPQHPDLETGALTVRATGLQDKDLFCFLMECMGPARRTIFFKSQFVRGLPLIFCRRIVPVLALFAGQCNNITHLLSASLYSIISLITPAPTVRPPSRMANRSSFSMAMGVIRLISMLTLSPGITISTPSGSVVTPVTSVVRK